MWISKRELKVIKEKIAALEQEQLYIREILKSNYDSNKEVIEVVKQLRNDLGLVESVDANICK